MSNIYKPEGSSFLSDLETSQIRLGIQGPPFSGKTTSTLTFPNPVTLSFDKKLNQHTHRSDVIVVPFWNDSFVDSIYPRSGTQAPVNRKDALLKWLSSEGQKLTPEQTLIADGSTFIEESFHIWYRYNEDELALSTKTGKIDHFVQWNLKKSYFEELFCLFKTLQCNVVYITHESPDRDEKGNLNGKIRPLLTGQMCDKMAGNFTDWFRLVVKNKPELNEDNVKKAKEAYGIDRDTLVEWINSTPTGYNSIHLWQTQPDEQFDGGTSSLFNAPKLVIANYSVFNKYKRRQYDRTLHK
jgi:AAA domain